MPQVRCRSVSFYSPEDEAAFFSWAVRIPGVSRVFGEGREIVIVVRNSTPSETTLRELLALLYRYKVSMSQLAGFVSEKNASWFKCPEAYWYRKVFGNAS